MKKRTRNLQKQRAKKIASIERKKLELSSEQKKKREIKRSRELSSMMREGYNNKKDPYRKEDSYNIWIEIRNEDRKRKKLKEAKLHKKC